MRKRIASLERQLERAKARPAKRPTKYRELSERTDAVCRQIRGIGQDAADPDDLLHLWVTIPRCTKASMDAAVYGMRRTERYGAGHTNTKIGDALGMTRQAVQGHWPPR